MTRGMFSLSFAPLRPLREILLLPLVHHRLQAHAKDAKAAKKATISLPKPTASTCGVPRARLIWLMTRERLSPSFAPFASFCVRSCGCPCLLTASKLTQRTPRPQRSQLSQGHELRSGEEA